MENLHLTDGKTGADLGFEASSLKPKSAVFIPSFLEELGRGSVSARAQAHLQPLDHPTESGQVSVTGTVMQGLPSLGKQGWDQVLEPVTQQKWCLCWPGVCPIGVPQTCNQDHVTGGHKAGGAA